MPYMHRRVRRVTVNDTYEFAKMNSSRKWTVIATFHDPEAMLQATEMLKHLGHDVEAADNFNPGYTGLLV